MGSGLDVRHRRSCFAAVVIVAAVSSCNPPVSSERSTRDDSLTVRPVSDGVFCDGVDRPAATITGALPGETIEFTSPMPVDIPDATADTAGGYELMWRCEELESELTWEVTATGAESGRSRRFLITGSDRDPQLDRILVYRPLADEVLCDDRTRVAGRLRNAEAHEPVEFSSSDGGEIFAAIAGSDGIVDVRWTCSPTQDGEQWRFTATGANSGRTAEFTIRGRAPRPAAPGGIVVELIEDPFVCDRGRRPVARVANLTPNAVVEFDVAPEGEPLRSRQAGANGELTLFWQCDRRDEGTVWELTVAEATPAGRSTTFSFGSATLDSPVTVELIEGRFVCNGETRQVAVLRHFVPRETIDFESPQSETIRQGMAGADGSVPVRWTCDTEQAGTVWEVTATGLTSGASLTFTITGVAP